MKSFKAKLNSRSGLPKNRMITPNPTHFFAFGAVRERITTLMTVVTFQPFELLQKRRILM